MINILLANQTIREILGMEEGQTFMEYAGDLVISILIVRIRTQSNDHCCMVNAIFER